MANEAILTRQTRDSFDVAAVRAMLLRGDSPPQGWVSLMDEALHLISRLREATAASRNLEEWKRAAVREVLHVR